MCCTKYSGRFLSLVVFRSQLRSKSELLSWYVFVCTENKSRPGGSVGIATDYRLDGPGIESQWGRDFPPVQTGPEDHPASCKTGTGSFPGAKVRPGRAADHSPPSSAAVMEEQSYTSTHPLGHIGPVTGSLCLFTFIFSKSKVFDRLVCCAAQFGTRLQTFHYKISVPC